MASKDFDIDQLAAYLHITPNQVTKMVTRGKLPGRRVNGQWRFSESEIHHWLEEQIGIVESDELQRFERILEKNFDTSIDERTMLCEFMSIDAIAIPLDARTKTSVVREMCNVAAGTGLLWDAAQMAEAVSAREALHPTALENGVALLHPRLKKRLPGDAASPSRTAPDQGQPIGLQSPPASTERGGGASRNQHSRKPSGQC